MSGDAKIECLEDLRRKILSMDLAPGTDLDEATLSAAYGISRTPLREILQHLAGKGYIHLEARRGAKVASMDLTVLRTFFQTAPMIYANIAFMAATHRTQAQLDTLIALQESFAQATAKSDAASAAFLNHRFHEQIGEMAHNPYLMACLDRLLIDHTRLSQTFYRPVAPSESMLVTKAVEQHDAMIAAFQAGEPALAMDLTLQHWDLSRDRMERYVRPDPLPIDIVAFKDRRDAV